MGPLPWLALVLLGHFATADGEDSSCLLSFHRKKPATGGGILFIIKTHELNYDTRLRAIMDTWGQEVLDSEANDVIFFGDRERKINPKVVTVENCGYDDGCQHPGICCKNAVSLIEAYRYGREKFNWYFVLDDDVYLHQENAVKGLSKYDPSIPRGLGIVGCGHCVKNDLSPTGEAGFCGGGGYVLSQAGMREWMKPSTKAFFDDYMGHITDNYDDVTSGCQLREHGIKVEGLVGLNGWAIDGQPIPGSLLNTRQMEVIRSTTPLPITFHYVDPEIVRALHQQFHNVTLQATANTNNLIVLAASQRVKYQEQLQCYVSTVNARRAKGSFRFGEAITC